jgi:hypothetical protein
LRSVVAECQHPDSSLISDPFPVLLEAPFVAVVLAVAAGVVISGLR